MGVQAQAMIEINAFALPGDPVVLDTAKASRFLKELFASKHVKPVVWKERQAMVTGNKEPVDWMFGRGFLGPGRARAMTEADALKVNTGNPEDAIDEELFFSTTVRAFGAKFDIHSVPEGGNEYEGNEHDHSVVVSTGPNWNETATVKQFQMTCARIGQFRALVLNPIFRKFKMPAKAVTDCVCCVTT